HLWRARQSEGCLETWPGAAVARTGGCSAVDYPPLLTQRVRRSVADLRRAPRRRYPRYAAPLMESDQLRDALRLMLTIRHFDERALALSRAGEMRGTTHPYIGMEAVGVGVMLALRPDDYVTSTHRGHGHTIAKGGDPKRMMAELLGRATGYSG